MLLPQFHFIVSCVLFAFWLCTSGFLPWVSYTFAHFCYGNYCFLISPFCIIYIYLWYDIFVVWCICFLLLCIGVILDSDLSKHIFIIFVCLLLLFALISKSAIFSIYSVYYDAVETNFWLLWIWILVFIFFELINTFSPNLRIYFWSQGYSLQGLDVL